MERGGANATLEKEYDEFRQDFRNEEINTEVEQVYDNYVEKMADSSATAGNQQSDYLNVWNLWT